MAVGPDGQPMTIQAGMSPFGGGGQRGPKPASKKKDESESESKDDSKAGEKKEGEAKEEGDEPPMPKVIRRDSTTDDNSDPDELKASVGGDGRVAFEFRNQPWVELVQWLADISEQPLDWLELPGDRVNMRSPGRYTVAETRDLFNRYLLARGYTLLEVDGGLTVAKTEGINAAIVPRVSEAKLMTLQPYSFVRASLDVGWLSAEKLAEELAPMISSNGKLTALTTTNRIEAMDAVINLRQVAELLSTERDSTSREALAPEFKLRYLPAEEAKLMLEQFLGVEKKQAAPMTAQQIQMMQQMRNQNKGAAPPEKKVEISIVANTRLNSVIIRAPADRLAIAMEFLKRIDLPSDSMVSLSDIQSRVQVFRLESLDPEKLIEIVSELNVLEPTTRVRIDKENNALIVSGSMADRYVIGELIKRLDGTGRSFEVMPLRRLDPAEVAESISFLMGQKDKDDDKSSGRRSYYYGYSGRDEEEKKETDEFRVAANTRYRQVLLWANEQEMEEVRSLLVKLGELPPPGGSRQTVRSIDASATPETLEYLRRLKQQWERTSPNTLELPDIEQFKEPNNRPNGESETDEEDDETAPAKKPMSKDNVAVADWNRYQFTATQESDEEGDSVDEQVARPTIRSRKDFDRAFGRPKAAAKEAVVDNKPSQPIRIEIDADGNLILTSPDTEALDQLENMMLQIKPPKRPYQVFHIEHASAYWMRLNLEEYFEDLEDSESDADSFFSWYWGSSNDSKKEEPSGLGKGNKMRFVDDLDTNTLVINGATNEQLRTIAELIELWDVPEPVNKRKTRFTRLIKVSFGKADKIAETVKEAYRDLLSSNDKAFAGGKGQGQNGAGGADGAEKSRGGSGSSLQNGSGQDGGSADFSFKGKLSLGIDEIGNTLLVSAEGEPLLELVEDMILQLDEAARPKGDIQVIRLPGGMSGDSLRSALEPLGADAASLAGPRSNGARGPGRKNPSADQKNE
ncbi:MAG: secretin N-terminal domain-containing protein [Rubripirellula sp.]